MLANPSPGLAARLKLQGIEIHGTFEDRAPLLKTLLRVTRVRQWPKNFLIFLPLILAHKVSDRHKLLATFIGFLSFSLIASTSYILNDMLDVEADRNHPPRSVSGRLRREISRRKLELY